MSDLSQLIGDTIELNNFKVDISNQTVMNQGNKWKKFARTIGFLDKNGEPYDWKDGKLPNTFVPADEKEKKEIEEQPPWCYVKNKDTGVYTSYVTLPDLLNETPEKLGNKTYPPWTKVKAPYEKYELMQIYSKNKMPLAFVLYTTESIDTLFHRIVDPISAENFGNLTTRKLQSLANKHRLVALHNSVTPAQWEKIKDYPEIIGWCANPARSTTINSPRLILSYALAILLEKGFPGIYLEVGTSTSSRAKAIYNLAGFKELPLRTDNKVSPAGPPLVNVENKVLKRRTRSRKYYLDEIPPLFMAGDTKSIDNGIYKLLKNSKGVKFPPDLKNRIDEEVPDGKLAQREQAQREQAQREAERKQAAQREAERKQAQREAKRKEAEQREKERKQAAQREARLAEILAIEEGLAAERQRLLDEEQVRRMEEAEQEELDRQINLQDAEQVDQKGDDDDEKGEADEEVYYPLPRKRPLDRDEDEDEDWPYIHIEGGRMDNNFCGLDPDAIPRPAVRENEASVRRQGHRVKEWSEKNYPPEDFPDERNLPQVCLRPVGAQAGGKCTPCGARPRARALRDIAGVGDADIAGEYVSRNTLLQLAKQYNITQVAVWNDVTRRARLRVEEDQIGPNPQFPLIIGPADMKRGQVEGKRVAPLPAGQLTQIEMPDPLHMDPPNPALKWNRKMIDWSDPFNAHPPKTRLVNMGRKWPSKTELCVLITKKQIELGEYEDCDEIDGAEPRDEVVLQNPQIRQYLIQELESILEFPKYK